MKRIRVGFVLKLDEWWLGGVSYYRNLITAIYEDPRRTLDVVLFVDEKFDSAWVAGFPDVEVVRTPILNQGGRAEVLRRWTARHFGNDFFLLSILRRNHIDLLSHYGSPLGPSRRPKVLAWIPDFQHIHLPEYFSKDELSVRNQRFAKICRDGSFVVVSSESARADLIGLFPDMADRSAVLRFVPQVESSEWQTGIDLQSKYQLGGPFMHLPNQYWAHKNHRLVIEAIGLLAKRGCRVRVVSTGHQSDYRDPKHYELLQGRIAELAIESSYRNLGVVPYVDMIALMKESICVINPSRFEGWSTTVEEAKALGKFVLLSDIPVHREQSPRSCAFFGVDDVEGLADLMWSQWQHAELSVYQESVSTVEAHRERRFAFAEKYREIVAQALAS